MGQSTEELTTDIEHTRRDLSRDLDALHERVSPHQVMARRKQATRSKLHSMKEKVMGSAHDAKHSASATGSSAADSVSGTAQQAVGTVPPPPAAAPRTPCPVRRSRQSAPWSRRPRATRSLQA